jgi:hypothetical protein
MPKIYSDVGSLVDVNKQKTKPLQPKNLLVLHNSQTTRYSTFSFSSLFSSLSTLYWVSSFTFAAAACCTTINGASHTIIR